MTRTPTQPLDDPRMWRQEARNAMCNGGADQATTPPPPRLEPRIVHEEGRIPFPEPVDFEELTAKALKAAAQTPDDPVIRLLMFLDGCVSLPHLHREESRGATYRQCAFAARLADLSYSQRQEWYRVCESVPLSQRHLGHLIKRLKEEGAA